MHIPTHMIEGAAVPQITAAAAAAGIAASAWFAAKKGEKPSRAMFASVTAFVFAAQMINFPVQSGTSGHLIGAVLAVMVLGIPHGILSMAVVLIVQTLLFADGGLDVLGANILNMAIVAAIPAALARFYVTGKDNYGSGVKLAAVAAASWLSVMLASFSCSLQLAASGAVAASLVIPAMASVHAVIGIGEAAITVAAVAVLGFSEKRKSKDIAQQAGRTRGYRLPLGAAFATALVLSPFASSMPDGLERVALQLGFLHESMPLFASPMSDYAVPFISAGSLSTSAAGAAGTAAVFALAWVVEIIMGKRSTAKGTA